MARRRHGWQLPAHPLQILALTVFSSLAVSFYAFFAPFLGKEIYEYIAIGVYTTLTLSVFTLYARCTAIDPVDLGTLGSFSSAIGCGAMDLKNKKFVTENSICTKFGHFFCGFLLKEDCRMDVDFIHEDIGTQNALFCTLCDAEVGKFSKHCRSCDKCVDGFDHHCRWLNNCVGRKNYISFVCLVTVSLVWFITECGVGITVLVRCFVDKENVEYQISKRLGVSFSLVPFATVVALCTIISFVVIIPLGELFVFHMILIQKGITTYEYIMAMRSQSEAAIDEVEGRDEQSLPSPTSSVATAFSGKSSLGGLQYRGAWCTPPRLFVDFQFTKGVPHQDEMVPHLEPGRLSSTADPNGTHPPLKTKSIPKSQVRISPWKLARLDAKEATRLASKARASSSVFRSINPNNSSSQGMSTASTPASIEMRNDGYSNFSSPLVTDNPIYQTSSVSSGHESYGGGDLVCDAIRRNNSVFVDVLRSSVTWDQEAGRFIFKASTTSVGSSSDSMFYKNALVDGSLIRSCRREGELPVFHLRDSYS